MIWLKPTYANCIITMSCMIVLYIGPARAPQYSYSGTSGYGDWRGDYTPRQTYRSPTAPRAYDQYTAGLNEEEQIAEATRQSLRNGDNCVSCALNCSTYSVSV